MILEDAGMSNIRPFRRRLAVNQKAISKRRKARQAGRWPFGGPSLSSVRRWLKQGEAAGLVTHTVERKRGRPWLWTLTEAGKQHVEKRAKERAEHGRSDDDAIVEDRVVNLLRRAKGKPLTEDQIIARYKEAIARRDKAAREMAKASA